jgi:deoxyribose-phosphate aldolase
MGTNELIQAITRKIDELGIKQTKIVNAIFEKPAPIKQPSDLAQYIEHTLLKPEATREQIAKLCDEAKRYNFKGVCINPLYVAEAKKQLKGTNVLIVTVIGFPLGANTSQIKAEEAKQAIKDGADEVDMVISVGLLKGKEYKLVYDDIRSVVSAAGSAPVKVIIENCLLDESEKIVACLLSMRAGASYVKTSTGFSKSGATPEDVALMREVVGDKLGIKAAGGIRDYETAKKMIEAGANRLGCSASIEIVTGMNCFCLGGMDMSEKEKIYKYAWDWFHFHAKQRMVSFYYYLIIIGALSLTYVQLMCGDKPKVLLAVAVGYLGAIISIAFLVLDRRNRELVDDARNIFDELEKEPPFNKYKIRGADKDREKLWWKFGDLLTHTTWLRVIMICSFAMSLLLIIKTPVIDLSKTNISWINETKTLPCWFWLIMILIMIYAFLLRSRSGKVDSNK